MRCGVTAYAIFCIEQNLAVGKGIIVDVVGSEFSERDAAASVVGTFGVGPEAEVFCRCAAQAVEAGCRVVLCGEGETVAVVCDVEEGDGTFNG